MAIAQAYALARHRRHRRRGAVIDHTEAQAIGDEQHDVVRLRRGRLGKSRGPKDDLKNHRTGEKRAHDEAPCKRGDRGVLTRPDDDRVTVAKPTGTDWSCP